jgi:hypothetical protein
MGTGPQGPEHVTIDAILICDECRQLINLMSVEDLLGVWHFGSIIASSGGSGGWKGVLHAVEGLKNCGKENFSTVRELKTLKLTCGFDARKFTSQEQGFHFRVRLGVGFLKS